MASGSFSKSQIRLEGRKDIRFLLQEDSASIGAVIIKEGNNPVVMIPR